MTSSRVHVFNVRHVQQTSSHSQPNLQLSSEPQHHILFFFSMSFVCSVCRGNFRSQGGLTKHMNLKHGKSSTLAGMAEASQLHTFIRHPFLSGERKPIFHFSYKSLNIYEPNHVHPMVQFSKTPSRHRKHQTLQGHVAVLGILSVTGSNTSGHTTTMYNFNPQQTTFSVASTSGEQR